MSSSVNVKDPDAAADTPTNIATEPPVESNDDPEASRSSPTGRRRRRRSRSRSSHSEETDLPGLLALLGEDEYELFEVAPGSGVRKIDTPPDMKSFRTHKRPFIIRRKTAQKIAQEQAQFTGGPGVHTLQVADGEIDQLDYLRRFRPDKRGEERAPNGRIWRVYLNEAGQFDANMIETMRDTVDVILVFAALFSAIVTTLVAFTASALQLDQPKVTNHLLMELIALQRVAISGGSVDQVEPSPLNPESLASSTAEVTDYWINGLWFTSLAFSLSTALLAVLVRQWIQAYEAPTFQGTPKARAEVRHFRYYGIERWHVPLIIGLLPTLLHIALFLFFAGLIVFLFTLDRTIAYVVTAITSVALAAYLVTNMLPVCFASCPYKTPLSTYAFPIRRSLQSAYSWLWEYQEAHEGWFQHIHYGDSVRLLLRLVVFAIYLPFALFLRLPRFPAASRDESLLEFLCKPLWLLKYCRFPPRSLKAMEVEAIQVHEDALHIRMFAWLLKTSPNPSARAIVTSCVVPTPKDLIHIQPPLTSGMEWVKIFHQAISAQVTNPTVNLHPNAFHPWAGVTEFRLRDERLVDNLISAHQYSTASGLHFIGEEEYGITSSVKWNWDGLSRDWNVHVGQHLAVGIFLQRFCLHALHHATPGGRFCDLATLATMDLTLLYPAMRTGVTLVQPTPDAVRKLRSWFPTPDQADLLEQATAPQLQLLLEVATCLLGLGGMEFFDIFMAAGCMTFWKRIYESHCVVIRCSQDLPDAFERMIDSCRILELIRQSPASTTHLRLRPQWTPYLFEHLTTVCLWEVARRAHALHGHIQNLIREDPTNSAWQQVQDTLLDHLTTAEATTAGKVFLARLGASLRSSIAWQQLHQ